MALPSFLSKKLRAPSISATTVAVGLCVLLVFATSGVAVGLAQTSQEGGNARVLTAGLEPIAPFVNKDTLFVARIDFDRIDYNVFNDSLKQIFNKVLEKFQFDEESKQACLKEFDVTAKAATENLKRSVGKFKETIGLSDVYFVVQTTRGEGACIIAPARNLTSKQQEECKKFADENHFNCALYQTLFQQDPRGVDRQERR